MFPRIDRIPIKDGREVLAVRVDVAGAGPVTYRGVPYERVLNTTRVMSRSQYHQLLIETLHAMDRWENESVKGWDVSMLDTREMVLTLEEAIRRGLISDNYSYRSTTIRITE